MTAPIVDFVKKTFTNAVLDGVDPWEALARTLDPHIPTVVMDFIEASRQLDAARSRLAILEARVLSLGAQVSHSALRVDEVESCARFVEAEHANLAARLQRTQDALKLDNLELQTFAAQTDGVAALYLELQRRAAALL